MISSGNDCETVEMQLPTLSASCNIRTVGSEKYLRFKINGGDFLDQNFYMTENTPRIDNNIKASGYVVQDQNYNIGVAFDRSTIPSHKMHYTAPIGLYGKTLNNGDFINQRRNQWKGNKVIDGAYNSDVKQVQMNNEGNGYRYRYNTNNFNNNGCDNLNGKGSVFCNTLPLTQHNSTNGLKNKYHSHHKRIRRYNNNYSDEIYKRAFGLMERFKSIAETFRINSTILVSCKLNPAPLDQAIWDLFLAKAQTEETYMNKLDLWQKLYIHIGKLYARFALFMVGSTMCGLATQDSDIDMCLLLRSVAADPRHEAVNYLEEVRKSLINCDFVKSVDLIQAKVPILKCVGVENGFAIDLNYNNAVGIRNTHLLYCYSQLDWRVRPLVIMVKLWAQANSINDAKHMTISSYSLALMVIHYLQCGTSPPLLPCLHNMYPNKFNPEKEIYEIDLQDKIPYASCNHQSLGELLMGFLHYYACFNYETDAISVRLASRVSIDKCRFTVAAKNDIHQWKYLCIEEPFDFTNTARSVYDLDTFRRIQRVFQDSSSILRQTGDLNLILKVEENQR